MDKLIKTKQCLGECKKILPFDNFYKIKAKDESKVRFEKICKNCKKQRIKTKKEMKNVTSQPKVVAENSSSKKVYEDYKNEEKESEKYFKEYKYPDGRVLRLTKEEFEAVCEAFKMLLNSERKREGKPLLRG